MSTIDEKFVEQDAKRLGEGFRTITAAFGDVMEVASPEDDTSHIGDGEGLLVSFQVGSRGKLKQSEAREYAKTWKTFRARHPRAMVTIFFLGYDTDPREIWDIPECTRYLKWFAEAAGIDKPSDLPPDINGQLFTLMGLCGVFGSAVGHAIRMPRSKGGEA